MVPLICAGPRFRLPLQKIRPVPSSLHLKLTPPTPSAFTFSVLQLKGSSSSLKIDFVFLILSLIISVDFMGEKEVERPLLC